MQRDMKLGFALHTLEPLHGSGEGKKGGSVAGPEAGEARGPKETRSDPAGVSLSGLAPQTAVRSLADSWKSPSFLSFTQEPCQSLIRESDPHSQPDATVQTPCCKHLVC